MNSSAEEHRRDLYDVSKWSFKNKEKQLEKRENPNRFYDFSIPYTSSRCDKIAKNLTAALKLVTPEYNVNFCWKTIKL